MNRRSFFKNLIPIKNNKEKIEEQNHTLNCIYPPYNNDISLFKDKCPDCEGMCQDACEQDVIEFDDDHIPYLTFIEKGCTLCEKCADVCDKDVLNVNENNIRIKAVAQIDKIKCSAWNKGICRSCLDNCEYNAIQFVGGIWNPNVIMGNCIGCGKCFSRCPTNAITMLPTN